MYLYGNVQGEEKIKTMSRRFHSNYKKQEKCSYNKQDSVNNSTRQVRQQISSYITKIHNKNIRNQWVMVFAYTWNYLN